MAEPIAYPYQALQWKGLHDGEIRIIILEPSTDPEAPIVCQLVARFLEDDPEYEALSYTWGPSGETVTITVQGHAVPIQFYLYNALRALRLADKPRRIWADALCINQNDSLEKSRVVRKMHAIYYRAAETIIWIGKAAKDTNLAFYVIRMLGEKPNSRESAAMVRALGSILHDKPHVHMEAWWTALANLFGRAYWTRAWIVQEIAYFKSGIVRCGPFECPFQWFSTACKRIVTETGESWIAALRISERVYYKLVGQRTPVLAALFRRLIRPEEQAVRHLEMRSLAYVLCSLRIFKATDPRDKVYGRLMLASNMSQPFGVDHENIDYSETCAKLYIRVARSFIELDSSLRILSCCESLNFSPRLGPPPEGDIVEHSHMSDLPSWTPNWAMRSKPITYPGDYSGMANESEYFSWNSRIDPFIAAGSTKADVQFSDDGTIMTAKGIILDTVCKIGETCRGKTLVDFILHVVEICGPQPRVAARYHGHLTPDLLIEFVSMNRNKLQRKLSPEDLVLRNSMRRKASEILMITAKRPVFTTTSGYICIGPERMSAHDIVCLLKGCFMPMLLRRFRVVEGVEEVSSSGEVTHEQTSFHHVIGPAYVHGVMEGEEAGRLKDDNLVDFVLR